MLRQFKSLVLLVVMIVLAMEVLAQDVYIRIGPGVVKRVPLAEGGVNVVNDLSGNVQVQKVVVPLTLVAIGYPEVGQAAYDKCMALPNSSDLTCQAKRPEAIQADINLRVRNVVAMIPLDALEANGVSIVQ